MHKVNTSNSYLVFYCTSTKHKIYGLQNHLKSVGILENPTIDCSTALKIHFTHLAKNTEGHGMSKRINNPNNKLEYDRGNSLSSSFSKSEPQVSFSEGK